MCVCQTLLVQKLILLLRESTGMPISVASVFEVQLESLIDLVKRVRMIHTIIQFFKYLDFSWNRIMIAACTGATVNCMLLPSNCSSSCKTKKSVIAYIHFSYQDMFSRYPLIKSVFFQPWLFQDFSSIIAFVEFLSGEIVLRNQIATDQLKQEQQGLLSAFIPDTRGWWIKRTYYKR